MPDQEYLNIVGVIADGQVSVLPMFRTTQGAPNQAQKLQMKGVEPILARQVDGNEMVVNETALPGSQTSSHDATPPLMYSGRVPVAPGAARIIFLRNNQEIKRIDFPSSPPQLVLLPPEGQFVFSGKQTFRWQGVSATQQPLGYLVCYSHDGGQSYRAISFILKTTSYVVDFDQLPGGQGQIIILASDNGVMAEARTPVIAIPPKPCYATIVAPVNNATVSKNGVVFQGQGYYREEQKPEFQNLQWKSSIDGNLGSGPSLAKKLSPGTHTITLTAGTQDRAGTATVTVTAQ